MRCLLPWLSMLAASLPAQRGLAELRGMVPEDAVMVVDVASPAAAVAELRRAIGELPESLPTAVRVPLVVGMVALWASLQGNPEAWAERVAGGGAVFAWLPEPTGLQPVAILRPANKDAALAWLQRFERVEVALAGELLVLAAESARCERIAARAGHAASRWAAVDFGAVAAVRGVVDLAAARQLAGPKAPRVGALDGGGRFLVAPVVHALEHAQWLRLALAGGDRLRFMARADASVRSSPFGELLSAATTGRFVPLAADGLLSLRVDRSLRALLSTPEKFLASEQVQAVRGFLSVADAIDGARTSFVDDLLGGLDEPFEVHVFPVAPVEEGPSPRLVLPGLAVVARLRDPAAADILFRAAQLLVIIANAERAQRGQSPFLARLERDGDGRGLVAEPTAWRGPGAPPIEQGLSPTLWCEHGVVILASTRAAVREMMAAARVPATPGDGDRLVLRPPAIAGALRWSRSTFELARMLDEGEDQATAARFFDVLFAVAESVREVALHVQCDADATTLDFTVERMR